MIHIIAIETNFEAWDLPVALVDAIEADRAADKARIKNLEGRLDRLEGYLFGHEGVEQQLRWTKRSLEWLDEGVSDNRWRVTGLEDYFGMPVGGHQGVTLYDGQKTSLVESLRREEDRRERDEQLKTTYQMRQEQREEFEKWEARDREGVFEVPAAQFSPVMAQAQLADASDDLMEEEAAPANTADSPLRPATPTILPPQEINGTPQRHTSTLPNVIVIPATPQGIPQAGHTMQPPPHNETAPASEETAPTVNETAPMSNETAPILNETAPILNETAPVLSETAPILNETAPTSNDTAPTQGMDEASPAMSLLVPAPARRSRSRGPSPAPTRRSPRFHNDAESDMELEW